MIFFQQIVIEFVIKYDNWFFFSEQEIDKKALLLLTESMLVELILIMGQRANFLSELEKLKNLLK